MSAAARARAASGAEKRKRRALWFATGEARLSRFSCVVSSAMITGFAWVCWACCRSRCST